MHVPGLFGGALCPAHVTKEHFRTLANLFGPNVPQDLPLFPSLDGQAVAKGAVVRTFECLAERCGKSQLDDLGRRAFGGQSARVTGARFYAGLGIELRRLAVFAGGEVTSSCIMSRIAYSQGSPQSASFSCARTHPNKSALMIIWSVCISEAGLSRLNRPLSKRPFRSNG